MKTKFIHIVNPVVVPTSSDLYNAQPITFETMRRSKYFSSLDIDISLLSAQYSEDREIVPDFLTMTPDLDRSVMDVGSFKKIRKLPLIADILDRAINYDPKADYLIYTNVDIAVMPYFYDFVASQIMSGLDAFIINRRTIADTYELNNLTEAYADIGEKHPGFDCFVFKRELFFKFNLGDVCIGANWIGRTIYANLITASTQFKVFENQHLTFHVGENGAWMINDYSEFDYHNKGQLYTIINDLIIGTSDLSVKTRLEELTIFVNNYGKPARTIEPVEYKPSLKIKVKKRLKKVLKKFAK